MAGSEPVLGRFARRVTTELPSGQRVGTSTMTSSLAQRNSRLLFVPFVRTFRWYVGSLTARLDLASIPSWRSGTK